MRFVTQEDSFEHRIINIVKSTLDKEELDAFEYGAELENALKENGDILVKELLYDIYVYMGFDDLLRQVKDE